MPGKSNTNPVRHIAILSHKGNKINTFSYGVFLISSFLKVFAFTRAGLFAMI